MADGFAADVREIAQYSEQWNAQAGQLGKLTAQLGTIESHIGALLENTFATDALNLIVGSAQFAVWHALRDELKDAASMLGTLKQQLSQDSENLRLCSDEYQIADQAAADGFSDVNVFLDEQKYDSPVQALLRTLSWDRAPSQAWSQGQNVVNGAGELIADAPGNVAKKISDTGPDFEPDAHEMNQPGYNPNPTPAPDPDAGGGQTVLG
jgi:ABC-type transporter Mla subunit MlaD